MPRVLLLDERILADGRTARTWAIAHDGRVEIRDDEGAHGMLSVAALDRVMRRYGRALDAQVTGVGEAVDLGGGYRLRRLRHHAPVDATGRDYLVWEHEGDEPIAVVARMVTAALRYLVMRLGAEDPQESEV